MSKELGNILQGPQRYAQMDAADLQRDPSPEAAAEIKRRNAMSTIYLLGRRAAMIDAALGDEK